jgi:phosphoserine phosphatase
MAGPTDLTSWRDGAAREAILRFVRSVNNPGPNFVPASERIATFDNDGTLWCEKPAYVQADFIVRKWKAMSAADPALAARQPYKAVMEGDREWLGSMLEHVPELVQGVSEAFGGITPDAFEQQVVEFFAQAEHPTLHVPYAQTIYQPMRELLALLEAHDFRVFICSGGGRDFVRPISEDFYGIPRERVIGTSAPVEYRDGRLIRGAGVDQPVDDGPGKPAHIWSRIGRLPLFAAGNADGDVEMLSLAGFSLLVHHDDADREFAYDTGAERALAEAVARGWTVASMKQDFAAVFGSGPHDAAQAAAPATASVD